MAVRFSDEQVMRATGGRRVRLGPRASYIEVCTDTRKLKEGCLFVALTGDRFDGHAFVAQAARGGAAGAVVQEGKPLPPLPIDFALFEVPDSLLALGALARFHRFRFQLPVGAVTGSNGKTTTKDMVASILETRGSALKTEGNLNNEIGVPLTLFNLEPGHVAAVVELGMNQPGEIARLTELVQPDAALITAVQPAHLSGLKSLEGIAQAKGELFRGLKASSTAVINLDDPRIVAQAMHSSAKSFTYGSADTADVQLRKVTPRAREGVDLVIRHARADFEVQLKLVGEHNARNAVGAFALAIALGYTPEECVRGLEKARPAKHRLTWLKANDVHVLDDCYNANPASMAAALDVLEGSAEKAQRVAVLGDMLELGAEEQKEHQSLGARAGAVADRVAFFGPRSEEGYRASGLGERSAHFTEVEPLVTWLQKQLRRDDVVLVKGSRGMQLERVVDALAGTPAGQG